MEDEADVPLSPLIDCVFLLLIFFLVTTMLKRKETMIPITMPDSSSALSAEARDDTLIIGLSGDGAFLEPAGRDRFGALSYQGGTTLDQYLDRLARDIGPEVLLRPIRFDIARETPFQRTIDALDICKLRGFMNVSVKIRQPFEE
ncbi:MAG: biopolymer transporter ExbD [Verrucomicrobia bacterium]|nr:biopolymer transporter ExbD [Verrucomicrobiota bacterium]